MGRERKILSSTKRKSKRRTAREREKCKKLNEANKNQEICF